MCSGCRFVKMIDSCLSVYSQWKSLNGLFSEISPVLFTEHKGVSLRDHCICLIDSPFGDDALHCRVTCWPHSAVILGLTSSFTISAETESNISLIFNLPCQYYNQHNDTVASLSITKPPPLASASLKWFDAPCVVRVNAGISQSVSNAVNSIVSTLAFPCNRENNQIKTDLRQGETLILA